MTNKIDEPLLLFGFAEIVPLSVWKTIPANRDGHIVPISAGSLRLIQQEHSGVGHEIFDQLRRGLSADGKTCYATAHTLQQFWKYIGRVIGGNQIKMRGMVTEFRPYCLRIEEDNGRYEYPEAEAGRQEKLGYL